MANLERFIEELMSFDDTVLPETTLALVEPYLRKSTFEPEALERKTNNSACSALCKWVIGVCRWVNLTQVEIPLMSVNSRTSDGLLSIKSLGTAAKDQWNLC